MGQLIILDENSEAIQYLSRKDKRLAKAIKMIGPIKYVPHEDAYDFLIGEILGQMLANKVSRKMYERLVVLCNGHITPESISALTDEAIRSIGTSKQKTEYIRYLTEAVQHQKIDLKNIKEKTDTEILKELTSLKGIGDWTAKMYLIFCLNRQDIIPYEDFAFLQGFGWLYKTDDYSRQNVEKKCKKWKPYSSIAARYMYKALDLGFTKSEFHLFK